jgi:hypothetical protein
MKYQVELANVLECAIERLYENLSSRSKSASAWMLPLTIKLGSYLYKVQHAQLTLRLVHYEDEVERGVASVHNA